jgi:hypothetical protein
MRISQGKSKKAAGNSKPGSKISLTDKEQGKESAALSYSSSLLPFYF